MKETPLRNRIMYRCSQGACRLFRMQVGLGWIGEARHFHTPTYTEIQPGDVLIRKARAFKAGIKGMHDLVGWNSVTVTEDMVGQKLAVYTSMEVKGEGRRVRT